MPGEGENCSLQLTYIVGFIDGPVFESDGPVIFGVEHIEEATGYFDETKKIGEGGYGSVYFGVIGEKVWKDPTSFSPFLPDKSYKTKPHICGYIKFQKITAASTFRRLL